MYFQKNLAYEMTIGALILQIYRLEIGLKHIISP